MAAGRYFLSESAAHLSEAERLSYVSPDVNEDLTPAERFARASAHGTIALAQAVTALVHTQQVQGETLERMLNTYIQVESERV